VDGTCSGTCKESNVTHLGGTPHLEIQGSYDVDSCELEGFLGFYPVGGKWNFNLLTTVVSRHLAWKTSVQHFLYGLTCTQNPKFFSEFG